MRFAGLEMAEPDANDENKRRMEALLHRNTVKRCGMVRDQEKIFSAGNSESTLEFRSAEKFDCVKIVERWRSRNEKSRRSL